MRPRAIAGRTRRALESRLARRVERQPGRATRNGAVSPQTDVSRHRCAEVGNDLPAGVPGRPPAVLCATPKEAHSFDHAYHRGEGGYSIDFPLASGVIAARARSGVAPAVCEVTPAYLFNPLLPERAHAFHPRLKLIAVLRDPVMRAYPQYQMQHREGREPLSFEDALANEAEERPRELERIASDPFASSETAHGSHTSHAGATPSSSSDGSGRFRTSSCSC